MVVKNVSENLTIVTFIATYIRTMVWHPANNFKDSTAS